MPAPRESVEETPKRPRESGEQGTRYKGLGLVVGGQRRVINGEVFSEGFKG